MKNFIPHEFLAQHKPLFRPSSEKEEHGFSFSQSFNMQAQNEDRNSPTLYQLAALAKRLSAARSRRTNFISPSLFGEPGWDMLLALFNAETGGYRMTVTSLCNASQVPATTALRWLTTLGELGLVLRLKNPLDSRVIFIELQPAARSAINDCLSDIWSGLFAPDDAGSRDHVIA